MSIHHSSGRSSLQPCMRRRAADSSVAAMCRGKLRRSTLNLRVAFSERIFPPRRAYVSASFRSSMSLNASSNVKPLTTANFVPVTSTQALQWWLVRMSRLEVGHIPDSETPGRMTGSHRWPRHRAVSQRAFFFRVWVGGCFFPGAWCLSSALSNRNVLSPRTSRRSPYPPLAVLTSTG